MVHAGEEITMREYGYGFIVLPEEQKVISSLDEGDNGTLFVDVSTWPHPVFPRKLICTFYYAGCLAKTNYITEDELMSRFPLSFSKKDAGEEYSAFRKTVETGYGLVNN